jgi:2-polyprenyl-3-methyl-5-hydroxy-6-metoxy-1,4-benzoquinol methylase
MSFKWKLLNNKIISCSYKKITFYSSTIDHWQNSVLRLLDLKEIEAKKWVESTFKKISKNNKDAQLKHFIKSTKSFFEVNKKTNLKLSQKFKNCIELSKKLIIKLDEFPEHGYLAYRKNSKICQPLEYKENYFQSKKNFLLKKGYANLFSQKNWRIEKSWRFYNMIKNILQKKKLKIKKMGKVIDIGTGYGFMLIPYKKNNFYTLGVDVSAYALNFCYENFSIKGIVSSYDNLPAQIKNFDLALCYDVIEHVLSPNQFINKINKILNKNAFIVIRTPNLSSLERYAFVEKFHSFKREHIQYFSVSSLSIMLNNNGFKIIKIFTKTQLFQGFLNLDHLDIEKAGLGSDIICIAQKV